MTSTELNAAIEAGTMTVTRLAPAAPRRSHLVMTRVGGSRSGVKGISPDGTLITGSEAFGAKRDLRRRQYRLK